MKIFVFDLKMQIVHCDIYRPEIISLYESVCEMISTLTVVKLRHRFGWKVVVWARSRKLDLSMDIYWTELILGALILFSEI